VYTGNNILKWAMQHLVIRGAAGGAAVSHYAAGNLQCRGLPEERTALVYGGVKPSAFAADEQDIAELRARLSDRGQPILLTVARLVYEKGHSQVIAALPQVLGQVGEVKYVIVGSGREKENLQQLVEQEGLAKFVTFCGVVTDSELAALYHAADLFIMTSRDMNGRSKEGLGLTYLEAGLCGLPAIGSNSGGVPDAIADDETGLLVNPEDPAQIADAIIRLISDEAFAQRLGQNAQRRVLDDFTWERVAERFQGALKRWHLTADG
jgi:phosphatidylinositol alpha-1,6-mannosyltransferase